VIALKRIKKLLRLARKSPRQRRYVELAKRISTRTRTRIPRELKRQICKGCNALLVPGKNSTVRVVKGRLVVKCEECGRECVTPFKPSK